MSEYYNPRRATRLFDPKSSEPFKISRSKIELFMSCPLCFYLDRRLGVARPPGFPFALNSAVDTLLKKEVDIHRAAKSPHPLMSAYGLKDTLPYQHKDLDIWRENFKGLECFHKPSNFKVGGAIDDVWVNGQDELMVVDYKATSKEEKVNIDKEWQNSYKRQMEIYQWILRAMNFKVSSTGYFVYCNGKTDRKAFDGKLEFDVDIIPYTGDDSWIDKTLIDMRECLSKDIPPKPNKDCDYCSYRKASRDVQMKR